MEDINKPDWLKAFEEDAKAFNESKWANLTDGEIKQRIVLDEWRAANPDKHEEYRQRALDNGWKKSEVQRKLSERGAPKSVKSRRESGYFESEEWRESQSKGGLTSGRNNVESGHLANIRPAATKASHAHVTCPKCGHTGSARNIKPIHFDNCIVPAISKIITNYIKPKEEVSIKVLGKQIADHLGVSVGRVEFLLKKFFVEPGIEESRYAKWRLK